MSNADVILRDVDAKTRAGLMIHGAANGRSMEAEALAIITAELEQRAILSKQRARQRNGREPR